MGIPRMIFQVENIDKGIASHQELMGYCRQISISHERSEYTFRWGYTNKHAGLIGISWGYLMRILMEYEWNMWYSDPVKTLVIKRGESPGLWSFRAGKIMENHRFLWLFWDFTVAKFGWSSSDGFHIGSAAWFSSDWHSYPWQKVVPDIVEMAWEARQSIHPVLSVVTVIINTAALLQFTIG